MPRYIELADQGARAVPNHPPTSPLVNDSVAIGQGPAALPHQQRLVML
jgi:hypothetical protein